MADEQVVAAGDVTEQTVNAEVSTDAGESGAAEPQANANDGEQAEHKRLGGWQRKIQKLERELAAIRDAKSQPVKEQPQPEPFNYDKPEPEPKDFDLADGNYDYTAYTKAMIQYSREKDKAEETHKQKQVESEKALKEQQSSEAKMVGEWRKTHSATIAKYPDFDLAIKDAGPVSDVVFAAIRESEVGAELAYHFANDPDDAARIAALPTWKQVREVSRLEAQFAPQGSAEEDESKEAPVPPVKALPAPPTPVSKPSSAKTMTLEEAPFKEFTKMREAHLKRK